jgi:hypothetical protein
MYERSSTPTILCFRDFRVSNAEVPGFFSSGWPKMWILKCQNVWPFFVTTLLPHLFSGFCILGLRDLGCNNSLPLRPLGIRNTKVSIPEMLVFCSKLGSTTHSLSWSNSLCLFGISWVKIFELLPFTLPVVEMPKSSFQEFPRNIDRSPHVLLLDGQYPFKILWVRSLEYFHLYLPVAKMMK